MSRPSLLIAPRPSIVVTNVKGRPPLTLNSVTPGPESASRSPRTKRGLAECSTESKRFTDCSVLCNNRVEKGKDPTCVRKCMDVQEFRTHSRCNGLPHVAPILDVEESTPRNKRWWVKMDYYPNGDLFEYIQANGKPSVDLAYKWAQQIAIGLDGIHRQGVIHRDIKPENILLDANLDAYIADFGRAYADGFGIHITSSTNAPSLNYGRPHEGLSTYTDIEDDWWSFGVIVYIMLTGHGFERPTLALDNSANLMVDKTLNLHEWLFNFLNTTEADGDAWLSHIFNSTANDNVGSTIYNDLTQVVYYAMHYDLISGKCNITQVMNVKRIRTLLHLKRRRSSSRSSRNRSSRSSRNNSRPSSRNNSRPSSRNNSSPSSRTKKRRKRSTSKDNRTKRPSSASQRNT